jgi:hypothetical protein
MGTSIDAALEDLRSSRIRNPDIFLVDGAPNLEVPRPVSNEQAYIERIQPRLGAVTISAIAAALGVCEAYAADIRAGRRRPHPRHWQALAGLSEISP